MSPGVILILGAGPRIGAGVALEFASHGFKVAVSSRSRVNGTTSPEGYLEVKADLFQPETIPQAFETVRAHFGNPPNVIVFNGGFRATNPPGDPFSLPLEVVRAGNTAGFESAYVAAQMSIRGFAELASDMPKTFIFTGNVLNQMPIPHVFSFAVSKRLSSSMVEYGAYAYGPKGYRFYYADQRERFDGRPAGVNVDGEAHGAMYWRLAQPGKQEKWLVTFTKNEGRQTYTGVDFDGTPFVPRY